MFTCRAAQECDLRFKVPKVHANLCVRIYVHACVRQKTASTVTPLVLPSPSRLVCFFALAWTLQSGLGILASKPQKSARLHCPSVAATGARANPPFKDRVLVVV